MTLAEFFKSFLEYFIPLFVTIDAFGLIPIFLGVTGGMNVNFIRSGIIEIIRG